MDTNGSHHRNKDLKHEIGFSISPANLSFTNRTAAARSFTSTVTPNKTTSDAAATSSPAITSLPRTPAPSIPSFRLDPAGKMICNRPTIRPTTASSDSTKGGHTISLQQHSPSWASQAFPLPSRIMLQQQQHHYQAYKIQKQPRPAPQQQQLQNSSQQQQQQGRHQPQPSNTTYPPDFTPAKARSQGGASIGNGNSMRSINTLSPNTNPSRTSNWQRVDHVAMSQHSPNIQSLGFKPTSATSSSGYQHRPIEYSSKYQALSQPNTSLKAGISDPIVNRNANVTIISSNSTPVNGAPFLRKKVVPKRNDRGLNSRKSDDSDTDKDANPPTDLPDETDKSKQTNTKDLNPLNNTTEGNFEKESTLIDQDVIIIQTIERQKKHPSANGIQVKQVTCTTTNSANMQTSNLINKSSNSIDPKLATFRAIPETESNNSKICTQAGHNKTMPEAALVAKDDSSDIKKTIPGQPISADGATLVAKQMSAKHDDKPQPEPKSHIESVPQNQPMPAPILPQTAKQATPEAPKVWGSKYSRQAGSSTVPFSWEKYLELVPAEPAPREAFMQTYPPPENKFKLGMKLEAKDPRNPGCWCLAHIVALEGMMLRLRFDGADSMNDMFELIDSTDIRPIGSKPEEQLLPPMAYRSNLSTYPKFVEKVLSNPQTIIASPEIFPPKPPRPKKNLFNVGMKLEALDRRQRNWIGPATISKVVGSKVTVDLDGWNDTYSYTCDYDSRNLFPINWSRDTVYTIEPPKNWDSIVNGEPIDDSRTTPTLKNASRKSSLVNSSNKDVSNPKDKSKISQASTTPCKRAKARLSKDKIFNKIEISKPGNQSRLATKHNGNGIVKKDFVKRSSIETSPPKLAKEIIDTQNFLADAPFGPSANDDDLDDTDQFHTCDKFSCQRTVPFADWRKRKLEKLNHDIEDGVDKSEPSFNTSDAPSQTSTNPNQDHREPGNSGSGPDDQATKRSKLDSPSSDALAKSRRRQVIACKPNSLSLWTVNDVLDLISVDETLAKYSTVFRDHEIDGKAFILLTTDVMINHLGLKIGPVLKINDLIEQVKHSR